MAGAIQTALALLRRNHRSWRDRLWSLWHLRRYEQLKDQTQGWVPACDTCVDHCCKAPHDVHLRLDDVARLRDAGHTHAIVAPPSGGLSLYAEPTLAKTANGDCVFFERGRCSIYALRPMVCQRFPYFIASDKRSLQYASSCQSRTPGDASSRRTLADAALASYNARATDAALVSRARSALIELGLIASSRFAEVLKKK